MDLNSGGKRAVIERDRSRAMWSLGYTWTGWIVRKGPGELCLLESGGKAVPLGFGGG
jgi:hypothetical protein